MKLLRSYEAGELIFVEPRSSEQQPKVGIPWPMEIWYDEPAKQDTTGLMCAVTEIEGMHLDLFQGTYGGGKVTVLPDTGATHCFVSREAVKRLKVHITPIKYGTAKVVNRNSVTIEGECLARLKLDSFVATVRCLVLPMLLDGVDIVLGQTFMKRYQGCLLYTSPSPRDAHESRMPSSA